MADSVDSPHERIWVRATWRVPAAELAYKIDQEFARTKIPYYPVEYHGWATGFELLVPAARAHDAGVIRERLAERIIVRQSSGLFLREIEPRGLSKRHGGHPWLFLTYTTPLDDGRRYTALLFRDKDWMHYGVHEWVTEATESGPHYDRLRRSRGESRRKRSFATNFSLTTPASKHFGGSNRKHAPQSHLLPSHLPAFLCKISRQYAAAARANRELTPPCSPMRANNAPISGSRPMNARTWPHSRGAGRAAKPTKATHCARGDQRDGRPTTDGCAPCATSIGFFMVSGFGASLRQQLDEFALSVAKLSELAGLSADRVVAIEAGADPTTVEVARLAEALAVDPAALWQGKISPGRTSARFRAPNGVSSFSPADARLLARAAELGRTCSYLQQALGRSAPLLALRSVQPVAAYPEPWAQGYALGAKARTSLCPDRSPIPSVQQVLEASGVHVAFVPFDGPDVIAASLYEPGSAPVILLNASAPRVTANLSRRAVLAHELCHLLHDGGMHDLLTMISRTTDTGVNEQRANGFAPSFIVPWGFMDPSVADPRDFVVRLGTYWGLSFEGATWHAKNTQHISEHDARLLRSGGEFLPGDEFELPVARLSTEGCGVATPSSLCLGLLSDLVARAYESDIISAGRAREILLVQ